MTCTQWPAIAHTPGVAPVKGLDALWPLENSERWFGRIGKFLESIAGGLPSLKTFGNLDRHMNGAKCGRYVEERNWPSTGQDEHSSSGVGATA